MPIGKQAKRVMSAIIYRHANWFLLSRILGMSVFFAETLNFEDGLKFV